MERNYHEEKLNLRYYKNEIPPRCRKERPVEYSFPIVLKVKKVSDDEEWIKLMDVYDCFRPNPCWISYYLYNNKCYILLKNNWAKANEYTESIKKWFDYCTKTVFKDYDEALKKVVLMRESCSTFVMKDNFLYCETKKIPMFDISAVGDRNTIHLFVKDDFDNYFTAYNRFHSFSQYYPIYKLHEVREYMKNLSSFTGFDIKKHIKYSPKIYDLEKLEKLYGQYEMFYKINEHNKLCESYYYLLTKERSGFAHCSDRMDLKVAVEKFKHDIRKHNRDLVELRCVYISASDNDVKDVLIASSCGNIKEQYKTFLIEDIPNLFE